MPSTPNDVKQYFIQINRLLTGILLLILVIASLIIWYTDALPLRDSSVQIGASFMLLAVVFYQLPYVSFLITRRHFASEDRQGIEILDSGWGAFKQWLNA